MAARREVVRQLREWGLSERQALRLVDMSTSTLRYQLRDDSNGQLRERLTELAGQHRRHDYRMLHSRLRLDGWAINVKRTYRVIRTDNDPEFAGRTMQAWAARNGVELRFIQPGKPMQTAYIESFNSRFRDECLSQHWFASLSHIRSVIDNWREDYNHCRPHSASGYVPPALFATRCRTAADKEIPKTASPTMPIPGLQIEVLRNLGAAHL